MPGSDPGSFRRALVLFKKEVTYGTDPTPVAGTDDMLVFETDVSLPWDQLERPIDTGYYGKKPEVFINQQSAINFGFELSGGGAAGTPPPWARIIECCGFAETINASTDARYNPVSDSFDSATIWVYQDQTGLFKFNGCRGNISFSMAMGNFPRAQCAFRGFNDLPEVGAVPSGVFTSFRAPVRINLANWAVTLDSFAADAALIDLDTGQRVERYEGSESQSVAIVNRAATGTIRIYDPGLAAKDYWAVANAESAVTLDSVVGTVAGDIVQLVGTSTFQLRVPRRVDLNGVPGLEMTFGAVPSSGNDEFEIVVR